MRIEDRVLDLPPRAGAARIVLGLLAEAVDAANALAAGKGDAPLHDFRVAVRRLRSALRTFRPWLEDSVRRRHVRRLGKIAHSTGAARDAEVQLAWLAERRAELTSPAHLPGHAAAVAFFEERVRAAPAPEKVARRLRRVARKLRRALRSGGADRRVAPGDETFAAALARLVQEHVTELADRVAAIRDAGDVERAHRARIHGKRLRYLVEPLRGARRADATAMVGALKALQDLLGDLHDAHVLGAELGDALAAAASERSRRVHAAALSPSSRPALRASLRASPRPGLLALVRLVRARRDALFGALERAFRGGAVEDLAARTRALTEALPRRRRSAIQPHPWRASRRSRRGSAGDGRPSRAP